MPEQRFLLFYFSVRLADAWIAALMSLGVVSLCHMCFIDSNSCLSSLVLVKRYMDYWFGKGVGAWVGFMTCWTRHRTSVLYELQFLVVPFYVSRYVDCWF